MSKGMISFTAFVRRASLSCCIVPVVYMSIWLHCRVSDDFDCSVFTALMPILWHATDAWISEIRHHRHWQGVLEHMCGSKLSALAFKLPEHGTVIGGTMSLQGHNITLACFHGINFRSKSWALFTMDEPYICFATEAADVIDGQLLKLFDSFLLPQIVVPWFCLHFGFTVILSSILLSNFFSLSVCFSETGLILV